MAEVSFYTDEHVGRAVVSGLSKRGVDVKTAAEAGLLGADDDEHFAFAYNEGRVILYSGRRLPHPRFKRKHSGGHRLCSAGDQGGTVDPWCNADPPVVVSSRYGPPGRVHQAGRQRSRSGERNRRTRRVMARVAHILRGGQR